MDNLVHSVVSADWHIGNKRLTPDETYDQIYNGFIEPLQRMKFLDIIIISGDFYNNKLGLNDPYTLISYKIADDIKKVAKEKGATIVILHGTLSHDNNQIFNLAYIFDDVDYHIIAEAQIIKIKGLDILCLPEEYLYDPYEYYAKYLDVDFDTYDMIVGHGLITEARFYHNDSVNQTTRATLFNSQHLCNICKGVVLFGHIHTASEYYNAQIGYVGSLLASSHDDTEVKSFRVISYNKKSGDYFMCKYYNEHTFKYDTMRLNTLDLMKHDAESIIDMVNKYKDKKNIDRLRIYLKYIDNPNNNTIVSMISKYFANDNDISITKKPMSEEAYTEDVNDIVVEMKPYNDKALPMEERVRIWAKLERNTDIEITDIRRHMGIK